MTDPARTGAPATAQPTVGDFRGAPSEWDGFVRRASNGTVCHLYAWRHVMEEVFGHETHYLAARGPGGRLRGVLPLVRVRSLLFGDFLVSMPFLSDGGPLGDDEAVAALAQAAAERTRAWGVDLLELRSREALPVDLAVSHRKITVVLDLPDDPEVLWKDHLKSKVRSQARRPRKAGMTASFGPGELGPFYHVFQRHMRDLGTPVLPRAWFEALLARFPDEARLACVYTEDGEPAAGGFGFRWEGEVEITWASALREHSRDAPNMLLYWAFMERAIEEGCERFNFGRCTPGSGTHRFKSQWGTRDVPLHWYQHPADGPEGTPSPDDDAWAWGPRVWRRLPLAVANRLGPRIVKHIP